MASVHAERLSFSFVSSVPLLAEVSFHLPAGWTGVVGENGAGKSTLLRLLTGDLRPDSGVLRLEPRGARVQLCAQSVEQLEPAIAELPWSADASVHRLLARLSLDAAELERWPTLSPGERRRWQLAAALAAEPDVLLLDEPTNHLDVEMRAWTLAALQRFRGVGLVVSHDRELLDGLTAHTLRLHRGSATVYPGGYSQARSLWEAEAGALQAQRAEQKEQLARRARQLHQKRRDLAGAAQERSTGQRMKDRYDSDARSLMADFKVEQAEKNLGRQVGVLRRQAEKLEAELAQLHVEKEVGRSLFVGYERPATPWLVRLDVPGLVVQGRVLHEGPLSLHVGREDRVRLVGANGAGKSTLLGQLRGACTLPPERVLWLPQDLTEAEERAALAWVRGLPKEQKGRTLSLLAALGVDPERVLASERPSAGEARKLLLAGALGQHSWLLLLDEPTNHLDLPSIERLREALLGYPGALVLVSHDAGFAEGLTSRAVQLGGTR